MKSLTALAVFFILLVSNNTFAADLNLDLKTVTLKSSTNELMLAFEDHEPVSGVCPLYIERMEYVAAVDTLMLTVKPTTPCLQDNVGIRKGSMKWTLPSMLATSSKLKLIVNGKMLTNLVIASGTVTQTQP